MGVGLWTVLPQHLRFHLLYYCLILLVYGFIIGLITGKISFKAWLAIVMGQFVYLLIFLQSAFVLVILFQNIIYSILFCFGMAIAAQIRQDFIK